LGVGRWTNNPGYCYKTPKRGGQSPYWAVEPYDVDDDDGDDVRKTKCNSANRILKSVASN
jgi:hypothetical protein